MIRTRSALLAVLLCTTAGVPVAWPDTPPTPKAIVDAAPAGDWRAVAPETLLVIDFAGGRRVLIELADAFAPCTWPISAPWLAPASMTAW